MLYVKMAQVIYLNCLLTTESTPRGLSEIAYYKVVVAEWNVCLTHMTCIDWGNTHRCRHTLTLTHTHTHSSVSMTSEDITLTYIQFLEI